MVGELLVLARRAWNARIGDGDTGPQILFLEALAKKVATAHTFTGAVEISRNPKLLLSADGRLSTDEASLGSLLESGSPVTMEIVSARIAAFAPNDLEAQEAAEIARGPASERVAP